MYSDVAIVIPSRIGSSRLKRKALAKIGNKTLIEHVLASVKLVMQENIYVATDSEEIAKLVQNAGAIAIMTSPGCPTGSDRVFQALKKIPQAKQLKYVINVQGDTPFIKPDVIEHIITRLKDNDCDIVTPVVKVDQVVANNPSNVKVVVDINWKAMYFSRSLIPHGGHEFLYHLGIYGFHVEALEKFVQLDHSNYEKCEQLEQLRALDHGMEIGVCMVDEIPISVDTASDLQKAIEYYHSNVTVQQLT